MVFASNPSKSLLTKKLKKLAVRRKRVYRIPTPEKPCKNHLPRRCLSIRPKMLRKSASLILKRISKIRAVRHFRISEIHILMQKLSSKSLEARIRSKRWHSTNKRLGGAILKSSMAQLFLSAKTENSLLQTSCRSNSMKLQKRNLS